MSDKIKIRFLRDDGDIKAGEEILIDKDGAEMYLNEGNGLVEVIKTDLEERKNAIKRIKAQNLMEKTKLNERDLRILGYDSQAVEEASAKIKESKQKKAEPISNNTISEDEAVEIFIKCYQNIKTILKVYIDMPEEYYSLIALWIVGTYLHDEFDTFPLLFINAVKGSGKSRLLRLISALSNNGKTVIDLREAVLFRTAKNSTLCIDEFEGVGKKENGTLRTLINAAYKKGAAVERMKKVTKNGQESQEVERFDLYTPVAMANIWGIEDVLSDRCLSVVLEKSSDSTRIKLMEDFDRSASINNLKSSLNLIKCSLCSVVTKKNIISAWNTYIMPDSVLTTLNTLYTLSTPNYTNYTKLEITEEQKEIFNKINDTKIDGRNLELFFPLFVVAGVLGNEVFEESLKTAQKIVTEKKSEEYAESKDVSLVDFVSKQTHYRGSWKSIHDICREFRLVAVEDIDEEKWLNAHWIGRSLKRNKIIIQKRRVGRGVEVLLDIDKAAALLKRFKEVVQND